MDKEKLTINLKERVVTLQITEFDTDIDTDELTSIDYYNVLGEILTFPVIMNRIGNLKAEMDELVNKQKFLLDIKEAELQEYYRKKLVSKTKDSKGVEKIKDPTESQFKNATKLDKAFQNEKKRLFQLQKEQQYIDSLYWSIKSKDDKLNKLSEKLRPEEFEKEIVEDTINGIMIKNRKKLIK